MPEEGEIKKLVLESIFKRDTKAVCFWSAEYILKHENVKFYEDNFFLFDGELWISNAEHQLRAKIQELFAELNIDTFCNNHMVNEILGVLQRKTYIVGTLDPEPCYIPCMNGIVEIWSGELKPYSPEFFFTWKLPVYYDPEASCPEIVKFLESVAAPEDYHLLVEIAAYCLWRKYEIQKAVMLLGGGENGKSTYLKLVRALLGSKNIAARTLYELETNRFAAANLSRKLANIFSDLEYGSLTHSSYFKSLTGGDYLTVEKKYGAQPVEFENTAKLIFSANQLPETHDETDAFFRRWVILNFPFTFNGTKRDPDMISKITTREELSGFLNQCLMELRVLLQRGEFSRKESIEDIKSLYLRKSSPTAFFMTETLQYDPGGWCWKDELYNSLMQFCYAQGMVIPSEDKFFKDLMGRSQGKILEERRLNYENKRQRGFAGIMFKQNKTQEKSNGGING